MNCKRCGLPFLETDKPYAHRNCDEEFETWGWEEKTVVPEAPKEISAWERLYGKEAQAKIAEARVAPLTCHETRSIEESLKWALCYARAASNAGKVIQKVNEALAALKEVK